MRNLMISFFKAFLFLMVTILCAFGQQQYTTEYTIGPRDVLEIVVVGDAEFSKTYRVSESGTITLPYLEEIQVDGLTKSELERKITELLDTKNILENPQVIVSIQEYMSRTVAVLGEVVNPGTYELPGRVTLKQIIAQAGGETSEAGEDIEIIRNTQDGKNNVLRFSREDLYKDISYDLVLMPNDIVRVLPIGIVWIYIGGQVNNPGRYEVRKTSIPTLLQAIILAGDFAERASRNVILRRRDDKGKWMVTKYDVNDIIKGNLPDIQLMPDDIVVVPKSIF
jgi:polysaccharide export outer membrane protein